MTLISTMGHRELITEHVKLYGPKTYLEVGVLKGQSVEAAVQYRSINRMLLCDTNPKCADYVDEILTKYGFLGEVEWLIGRSQDLLPKVLHKFDFVHIDGSHFEEDEYIDLVNGWKLCKQVMIVHDFSFPSVQKAFDKFLETIDRNRIGISRFTGDQETIVVTK